MKNKKELTGLRIFLYALFGGFVGVLLLIVIFFAILNINDKLSTVKLTCVEGKETENKNVSCQILSIKDRKEILEIFELIDGKEKLTKTKRKTDGKFIEVNFSIKNNRTNVFQLTDVILVDDKNRSYNESYALEKGKWVSFDSVTHEFLGIRPGFEEKFSSIFEVPKDSQNFKLVPELMNGTVD